MWIVQERNKKIQCEKNKYLFAELFFVRFSFWKGNIFHSDFPFVLQYSKYDNINEFQIQIKKSTVNSVFFNYIRYFYKVSFKRIYGLCIWITGALIHSCIKYLYHEKKYMLKFSVDWFLFKVMEHRKT